MANVVRDPHQHPDAIIPDLATNNVFKFSKDQVAFVYGSIWKQRYFTKVAMATSVARPVEVVNKKWSKYRCPRPEAIGGCVLSSRQHAPPNRPLCDGCHSVGYEYPHEASAEWNVGGALPRPRQRARATPDSQQHLNPAHMNYVAASSTPAFSATRKAAACESD